MKYHVIILNYILAHSQETSSIKLSPKVTIPKEPLNKSVFLLAKSEVGRFLVTGSKNSGFGS